MVDFKNAVIKKLLKIRYLGTALNSETTFSGYVF
jgi:hypothetical protein